jgi:hypothetical protein
MDEIIEKRVKWIEYKGKEILRDDYTNLQGEELVHAIEVLTNHLMESGKKEVLLLIDLNNSYTNKEVVNAFTEAGKRVRPIVEKTAVLGITGVKKVLLNVVNKLSSIDANPFSTEEEAKEWLIS